MNILEIDYECCLKYTDVKDSLILYKCLCCNRSYQKRFDENFEKQFPNRYIFSNLISINLFCFC